jgi:hypothetical protein
VLNTWTLQWSICPLDFTYPCLRVSRVTGFAPLHLSLSRKKVHDYM